MIKINLIFSDQRAKIMSIGIIFLVFTMIAQLFKIQLIDHHKYQAMAKKEHVKSLVIPAKRGEIYLSNGKDFTPVVMNSKNYDLYIDPDYIKDKNNKLIIKAFKKEVPNLLVDNFEQKFKLNKTRYQVIARKLSKEQAEKIKKYNFLGVGLKEHNIRLYPEGKLASQVLGFVNYENKGQYGIEQEMNKELTGQDGYLKAVTDVSNIPLTIGEDMVSIEPKNGDNLVLTIDRNIQYQAEKLLSEHLKEIKAKRGSILVMNPNNGKIMAMANYPDYNPSEYQNVDNAFKFNNSIIDSPYEAGSVIKTFTVAMGLDQHKIKPNDIYNNRDCIKLYSNVKPICNVVRGLNYPITFQKALSSSLNTGMVEILKRMGDGKINKESRQIMYNYWSEKYRFGYLSGVELPERAGNVISPNKIQGNNVRYSNMTFGQGFTLNMVQASAAFSSIINGGEYYKPTIIRGKYQNGSLIENKPKLINDNVISKKASIKTREMVIESRSKVSKRLDVNGFVTGGKTGTSETIVNGKYNAEKTIASYLGFGGTTKQQKYVIMVRLSDSDNKTLMGYLHAEPLFNKMSNWMIKYLKIQPKE